MYSTRNSYRIPHTGTVQQPHVRKTRRRCRGRSHALNNCPTEEHKAALVLSLARRAFIGVMQIPSNNFALKASATALTSGNGSELHSPSMISSRKLSATEDDSDPVQHVLDKIRSHHIGPHQSTPESKVKNEPDLPAQTDTPDVQAESQEAREQKRIEPTPITRKLVIEVVEIDQLHDVSITRQTFVSRCFISFRIVGGAKDAALMAQSHEFPFDEDGRPTFRPSAMWYLKQIDFNNSEHYQRLDEKVEANGDDLLLKFRFEGTFLEPMELQDFPIDQQALNISLSFNVRTTGMTPVTISVSEQARCETAIEARHFHLGQAWTLEPHLSVKTSTVGKTGRQFPTVEIAVIISRKYSFYVINVGLPMFLFSFMSLFQFALPRFSTADRFNVGFTLLLTCVAFKFSITTMLPTISYMTILDKYTLASTGVIVAACFQAAGYSVLIDNRADVMFGPESGDGSMGDLDDVLEIYPPPPPSRPPSLFARPSLFTPRMLRSRAKHVTEDPEEWVHIASAERWCIVADRVSFVFIFGLWLSVQLWTLRTYLRIKGSHWHRPKLLSSTMTLAKKWAKRAKSSVVSLDKALGNEEQTRQRQAPLL